MAEILHPPHLSISGNVAWRSDSPSKSIGHMRLFALPRIETTPPPETVGSWNYRKWRLQKKFPQLTDQDLMLDAYNRDEMFQNLLTKLGTTDKELHDIIIAL